jgi:hypothetical protein
LTSCPLAGWRIGELPPRSPPRGHLAGIDPASAGLRVSTGFFLATMTLEGRVARLVVFSTTLITWAARLTLS